MKRFLAYISLFLSFATAFAIGDWHIFPSSYSFKSGEYFGDKIYLLSGNTLFSVDKDNYNNQNFYNKLSGLKSSSIFNIVLSKKANKLAVVHTDGDIDIIDINGQITNIPDFANKSIVGDRSITGISERDGYLYISTGFGFLIVDLEKEEIVDTFYNNISQYKDGSYGQYTSSLGEAALDSLNAAIKINGVGSSSNAALAYSDGMLITANVESDFRSSLFENKGVFSYLDTRSGEWTNLSFEDITNQITDHSTWFQGPTSLAIDPNDNHHFFIGSFCLGMFELEGDSLIAWYNERSNPDIDAILKDVPGTYSSRTDGIFVDEDGYTWFMNLGVENPLRCITPKGDILKFPISGFSNEINNTLCRFINTHNNPYGFKWIVQVRPWQECQAAIYYDAGTPEDAADDQSVTFTKLTDQDGNIILPNYFNDVAEDKDGKIWLMTTSGPFVFDSQLDAFNNPGVVRRIKIPRNDGTNLADYLLAGVDCFCIVVDAANRKWIGTKGDGLYLISADGLSQIEHFTTENSPLMSDDIYALAYDEVSGTMYISCEGGILSYMTDAVQGAENYSEVKCFPNPVRPEFSGNLHISGLKDKSQVKICDINNHVVYSTICAGGMISWDLTDSNGSRVKAGVYLVYGIDDNGKNGVVSKFLVVN